MQLGAFAQGHWELRDVPTQQDLRSVYFTDSLYGWAVGDTGTIIHTTDGGESWIIQDAGGDNAVVSVFFLNRQLGWAVSWNYTGGFFGSMILKTTNGGAEWHAEAYPEDNIFINDILFLDSLTGWVGGSPHCLAKTSDGGQSWNQAAIDTNSLAFFPVLNVYFYDENYGYACGGMFDIAGVIWSTSDGGQLWYPIENADAPADEIHGLHIFEPLKVLGAGGDPDQGYGVAMIRTEDGGENWNYEELSMPGNAFDIDFRNSHEAWAPLGPQEKLIFSLDTGTTWMQISSPGNTAIFDMIFTDPWHGYAVGYDGAFIKFIPEDVGVDEADKLSDINIQIFPNPAHRHAVVQFNVDAADGWSKAGIIISDSFGRPVKEISIHGLSNGMNSVSIDVSGLPGGMYVCKLILQSKSAGQIVVQKLILR
jgi:photosystem II stability/assembly factor-like uncharacterized protein